MQGHHESVCGASLRSKDHNKRLKSPPATGALFQKVSRRALKRYMDSEIPQVPLKSAIWLHGTDGPSRWIIQTEILSRRFVSGHELAEPNHIAHIERQHHPASPPLHSLFVGPLSEASLDAPSPIHDRRIVSLMGSHKRFVSS